MIFLEIGQELTEIDGSDGGQDDEIFREEKILHEFRATTERPRGTSHRFFYTPHSIRGNWSKKVIMPEIP